MKKHLQRLLLIVAMMLVPWVTQAQDAFSYSCNFDGDSDTAGWVFVNGSQQNQWFIGTATHNSGTKSLYISDDNGASNSYSASTSFVYAYQEFTLDSGGYAISYDWKCQGEGNYDYIRVFLAPTTVTLPAGASPNNTTTSTYTWGSETLPSGCISLTGSSMKLNLQSSWQNVLSEIYVPTSGTWRLVFAWANDVSVQNTPAGGIDNIVFMQPTCPRPSNLSIFNIAQSSFDISWTETGSATEWLVWIDSVGITVDSTIAYDTTASFIGRAANTPYTVRVAALCSGVDTSMMLISNFRTPCTFLDSLPYFHDFESDPNTSTTAGSPFINCWHLLNNATSYAYPYLTSSSTYNHTPGGNKGLYWYNTSTTGSYGDYQCVVLPGIDTDSHPINTLMMRVWAKSSSSSYLPVFNVGVLSDPNDISTFTPVDTLNVNSTNWTEFVTDFRNFEGSGNYICLMAWRASNYWYAYVDDFTLEVAPDCPRVEDLAVSNLSSTEADLSWTETGTGTSWTVDYGPAGDSSSTQINTTSTSITLTGLTPNTNYTVYVTVDCNEGNGVGGVNFISFRTACEAVPHDSLPYVEDFEAYSTGSSSSIDPCWRQVSIGTSGYPYVITYLGSKSLYFYGYESAYCSYAVLPMFEDSLNTLMVRFKIAKDYSEYGTISVGVIENPNDITTFHEISQCSASETGVWEDKAVSFMNYHGTGYICFLQISSYYTYIDDVTVDVLPDCPPVNHVNASHIGNTSALITWGILSGVSNNRPEEFEIEITDSTGTPITYTDTNFYYFVTGLQPLTNYTAKVRASCGGDGYGAWDSVTFQTPCPLGGTLPITGNGTTTSTYYLPLNNYYCYSYTQELILSSELNGPTTIYGIKFLYGSSSPTVSGKNNCTIYIGHTTMSSLSTTSFVDPTTMTAVYTGPMNVSAGWNEFSFTTPFAYDGTSNIVIAVDDNAGTYPGSSYTYTAYNCGSTLSMLFYSDSYNPDPTSTSTLNSYSGTKMTFTYRVGMELVMPCDSNPTCAPPNVVATEVGGSEVTIQWAPGLDETSWMVEYRPSDSNDWNNIGTESTTTYTFTGLRSNTEYQFRVTALCSDTDMASIIEVRTECAGEPIPFYENFETWPSYAYGNTFPSCWHGGSNYSSDYPYISTGYSHPSGNNAMYMSSGSGTYTWFTLPIMAPSIDSLQVSFWLLNPYNYYTHSVYVGVMEDPEDRTTFTPIDLAVPSTSEYTWTPFEVPLSSYTGNGKYIAFMTSSDYGYPYLDDITVEYISACPRVRHVASRYETGTTATVYWDTTSVSQYEVEYGPYGFHHGSGTLITGISDDSVALTGLHASSHYDVYVRGICDSGDTSNWSFAYSFYTECGYIDTLPFFEDFNSLTSSTSIHSPNCWYGYSTYSTSYPYPSSSYNRSGSGCAMYMYYYNSGSYYTMLQLPPVDTTVLPINSLQIEFSLLSTYSSYTQGIEVGVCSGEGMTNFVPIDTVWVTEADYTWQDFEVPLNGYTGSGNYITLKAYSGSSSYCYPYLDDVRLVPLPTCVRPRNLSVRSVTSTDATIAWNAGDSIQSDYLVRYGLQGCNVDTCAEITVMGADTVLLTGLDTSEYYDVYVRAMCDNGDTSRWSMINFHTLGGAPISTYPYICTFTGSEGRAWTIENGHQTNQWHVGNATWSTLDPMATDSMSLYISNDNGSSNSYSISATSNVFAYRTFNMPAGEYVISYDWHNYGESCCDYMLAGLIPVSTELTAGSTSGWSTSSVPGIMLNANGVYNMVTNWTTRSVTVRIDNAGTYNLAFWWHNDGSVGTMPPAAIDNVKVYRNTCPQVTNLNSPYVTADTIMLTWNSGSNETEWLVSYDSTSFTTTDSTIIIPGRSPNTNYSICVASICEGNDTGVALCTTIHTPCVATSLPYNENFETYTNGAYPTCWTYTMTGTASYTTGSYLPKVYTYSSYAHSGSNTLWLYGVGYFCLPPMPTSLDSLELTFWNYSTSTYYGLEVGAMEGNTFVPIQNVSCTTASAAYRTTVYLSSYTGPSRIIAFRNYYTTSSTVYYSYNYLDDIHVDYIPSCPPVTNLTSTGNTSSSITLNWTENGSATEWQIAVETSLSATPTPDTTVTAKPATINGLVLGTTYHFYVRAICGPGDTSAWCDVFSGIPGSWNIRPNQTDTLHMCGGVIYDDAGTSQGYANNQDSYIILYPDAPNNLVSISGSYNLESCCDYLRIHDGNSTSGTQLLYTSGTSSGTIGPFTSTSGPLTIYFHTDGSVNTYDGFTINVSCVTTTCRVFNIHLNPAVPQSDVQLAVTWDTNGADYYEVAWGTPGFTPTTAMLTTYINSATITGLTSLTDYDVCVRSICNYGADTGSWSRVTLRTALCDNAGVAQNWTSSTSSTTDYYSPIGYSCYNYSYTQVIIDSAQLASLNGDITAFGFKPSNSASSFGSYYTHMDIYMANISESVFSSGFIYPDTTDHIFVQVMDDGNLCYTNDNWQTFMLDTTFTWDGHSNVLFAVNRRHGVYSCSAQYEAHSASGNKMIYVYNDGSAYNINTVSGGYTSSTVGDLKFYSCGAAGCRQPVITGESHTYENATITWTGEGTEYEVNVKEAIATDWPATDIHVTGNTYTFTGLQPATNYTFRVRQDCNADSLGYSEWVISGFTTDSLPCLAPDSLHVTAVTNATATLDWVPFGYETMWDIHVWTSGGLDSVYTVTSHPATVGGFTANTSYNASVRPLCGTANNIIGEWGDTIVFTTAVCPDVTGLGTRNVTANSVDVYWNPDPMAQQWIIEYGFHGFDLGTGTQVITSLTTYTINGLIDDMEYDFRVRAVCGDNWQSEGWATTSATTLEGGVPCEAPTAVNAVVAGNAATVSWTANTGNISFVLEYGTRGFALGSGTTVNATASPITISNLAYETAYDVYVKASCADNTVSAWSTVASFTTEAQGSEDCDPVTDLAASNVTESAALLTWTPGNSGDEWEVVLTTAAGATVSETSTTERQFQLNSLTPGTAYVAKVRTVCGDGQYSTFVSVSFTTNSVGIADVTAPACTIYPNPTSGATTVSVSGISGKVRIAVVDMNGREVTSETLDCSGDCAKTMSVDNLAQGAYFVRITGENANLVRKLIVR